MRAQFYVIRHPLGYYAGIDREWQMAQFVTCPLRARKFRTERGASKHLADHDGAGYGLPADICTIETIHDGGN